MVKSDEDNYGYIQAINVQLQHTRSDIENIYKIITDNKNSHTMCRESILLRISAMDKEFSDKINTFNTKLEMTIYKVGLIMGIILYTSNYLLNYFIGK